MADKMLQSGIYKANNDEWDGYELTVDVKDTEKSIILRIVDYKFRYSPEQIDMLFKTDFDLMGYEEQQNIKNGKYRAIIKKQGSGHALYIWSDNSFTLYPYQSGIPFYFVKQ